MTMILLSKLFLYPKWSLIKRIEYPLTFPFLDELTEAFRFFEKFLLDCIGLSFWGCCLFSLALELGWFWKIAGLPIGPKGLEAIDMEAPLMRNTSIFRELFEKVTPRHFVRSMFRGAGLLLIFNLRTPPQKQNEVRGCSNDICVCNRLMDQ